METPFDSIANLCDYLHEKEFLDYEEHKAEMDDPDKHIFKDVLTVESWLDGENRSTEHRADLADWRYEVTNGDTMLGFAAWLEHRRIAEGS